jgi:NitT/TauT family transport system substrate-binding protein
MRHPIPSRRQVLAGATGLAAAAIARPALAADRITVRLDWLTWAVHAPYHLAAAKGWFAKHGLDVVLEDGNGSVTTVQLVANGQFDVGHAALGPMAMARSKGAPVKAIANFLRTNDIGLMVPRSTGITKIQDLRGRKLAYTASSLEAPFIDKYLAAGGLTKADIELIGVDGAAKPGVVISGRVDGVFSAIPNMLPTIRAQRDTIALRFADAGLSFPSFGLLANEKTIAEKSDALKRFASVVAGTWTYIYDGHQEEAAQAILNARPQAKLPLALMREQLDLTQTFFVTEATKDLPLGVMALADWEAGIGTLTAAGLLETPQPPANYFTNALLDAALIGSIGKGAV